MRILRDVGEEVVVIVRQKSLEMTQKCLCHKIKKSSMYLNLVQRWELCRGQCGAGKDTVDWKSKKGWTKKKIMIVFDCCFLGSDFRNGPHFLTIQALSSYFDVIDQYILLDLFFAPSLDFNAIFYLNSTHLTEKFVRLPSLAPPPFLNPSS